MSTTTPPPPLGPLEIWNVLLDQAREDDAFEAAVAATAALTDAEVEAELRLAGLPMAEVERAALAPLADLAPMSFVSDLAVQPVQAVAQVVPRPRLERPKRRRPAAFWLAAAATTATTVTVGGSVLYATLHAPPPQTLPQPAPVPSPSTPAPVVPAPTDRVAAGDLRARARRALAMGYESQCLDLLDQAKILDPDGDEAPDVVALRQRATSPEEPLPPKPSRLK